ncbi:MAG: orotidine 5'-phosphate decarboxylase / HUMPS family protein [Thermofilaceae archaeon]
MVLLQVALDLTDLDKAIKIASKVVDVCDHNRLLIEAGTPLIKSWGVAAVRKLAQSFSDIPIVADMKTIDAGAVETELALKSGAKFTTVLALASNETVTAVVTTAHKLRGMVIGDLICVEKKLERAKELYNMGIDTICFHVPIDVQNAKRVNVNEVLRQIQRLRELPRVKIAVAGGITPETASLYSSAGVDILIVGRYIYAAPDPSEAALKLVERIK